MKFKFRNHKLLQCGMGILTMFLIWNGTIYATSNTTGLKIGQIQGTGTKSPYAGMEVKDIRGVVFAVEDDNSFYMQDVKGDGNDKTSDGIYVYKPKNRAKVGDLVSVSGKVQEAKQPGETMTTTRIENASVWSVKRGQALPKAKEIKTEDIKNAKAYYSALESMYVTVKNPQIVQTESRKKIFAIPEVKGRQKNLISEKGGAVITKNNTHPEVLAFVWDLDKYNRLRPGDKFVGNVYGALKHDNDVWTVYVSKDLPLIDSTGIVDRMKTNFVKGNDDELRIATYELGDINATSGDTKITRLARTIADELDGPDIIVLHGVGDDSGSVNDGNTATLLFSTKLLKAIEGAGCIGKYQYVDIAPLNNQDDYTTGINTRSGVLYRSDKVKLSDINRGTATDTVKVIGQNEKTDITYNPGRIVPNQATFNNEQKPLVYQFEYRGEKLYLITCELSKKNAKVRAAGASAINSFTQDLLKRNSKAKIVVAAAINDDYFSSTAGSLEGSTLYTLWRNVQENERYTQIKNGKLRATESIFVTEALQSATKMEVLHINTFLPKEEQLVNHDPMIVKINVKQAIDSETSKKSSVKTPEYADDVTDPIKLQSAPIPQTVLKADRYTEIPVHYENGEGIIITEVKNNRVLGNAEFYVRAYAYKVGEKVSTGIQIIYEDEKGTLQTEWWDHIDSYTTIPKAQRGIGWPECRNYSLRVLKSVKLSSQNKGNESKISLTVRGNNKTTTKTTVHNVMLR